MAEVVVVKAEAGTVIESLGNRLTVCVTAAQTQGAFSSVEFKVAPGFVAPPLFHRNTREDWWGQVLEGEVAVETEDGVTQKIAAGGWVFVPRGVGFRWWNARQESARWQLTYSPGGFEGYFVELAAAIAQKKPASPQEMGQLAGPLWARYGVVISQKKS